MLHYGTIESGHAKHSEDLKYTSYLEMNSPELELKNTFASTASTLQSYSIVPTTLYQNSSLALSQYCDINQTEMNQQNDADNNNNIHSLRNIDNGVYQLQENQYDGDNHLPLTDNQLTQISNHDLQDGNERQQMQNHDNEIVSHQLNHQDHISSLQVENNAATSLSYEERDNANSVFMPNFCEGFQFESACDLGSSSKKDSYASSTSSSHVCKMRESESSSIPRRQVIHNPHHNTQQVHLPNLEQQSSQQQQQQQQSEQQEQQQQLQLLQQEQLFHEIFDENRRMEIENQTPQNLNILPKVANNEGTYYHFRNHHIFHKQQNDLNHYGEDDNNNHSNNNKGIQNELYLDCHNIDSDSSPKEQNTRPKDNYNHHLYPLSKRAPQTITTIQQFDDVNECNTIYYPSSESYKSRMQRATVQEITSHPVKVPPFEESKLFEEVRSDLKDIPLTFLLKGDILIDLSQLSELLEQREVNVSAYCEDISEMNNQNTNPNIQQHQQNNNDNILPTLSSNLSSQFINVKSRSLITSNSSKNSPSDDNKLSSFGGVNFSKSSLNSWKKCTRVEKDTSENGCYYVSLDSKPDSQLSLPSSVRTSLGLLKRKRQLLADQLSQVIGEMFDQGVEKIEHLLGLSQELSEQISSTYSLSNLKISSQSPNHSHHSNSSRKQYYSNKQQQQHLQSQSNNLNCESNDDIEWKQIWNDCQRKAKLILKDVVNASGSNKSFVLGQLRTSEAINQLIYSPKLVQILFGSKQPSSQFSSQLMRKGLIELFDPNGRHLLTSLQINKRNNSNIQTGKTALTLFTHDDYQIPITVTMKSYVLNEALSTTTSAGFYHNNNNNACKTYKENIDAQYQQGESYLLSNGQQQYRHASSIHNNNSYYQNQNFFQNVNTFTSNKVHSSYEYSPAFNQQSYYYDQQNQHFQLNNNMHYLHEEEKLQKQQQQQTMHILDIFDIKIKIKYQKQLKSFRESHMPLQIKKLISKQTLNSPKSSSRVSSPKNRMMNSISDFHQRSPKSQKGLNKIVKSIQCEGYYAETLNFLSRFYPEKLQESNKIDSSCSLKKKSGSE